MLWCYWTSSEDDRRCRLGRTGTRGDLGRPKWVTLVSGQEEGPRCNLAWPYGDWGEGEVAQRHAAGQNLVWQRLQRWAFSSTATYGGDIPSQDVGASDG